MAKITVTLKDEFGNTGTGVIELTAPIAPAAPLGPVSSTGWQVVMSDDFTTLDLTKWIVQDGRNMNGVLSKTANVVVVDGKLKLSLSNINGTVYGAMISSNVDYAPVSGKYMMKRGDVVEAMMYFPGTATEDILNWGGFWTSGPDWPRNGENDIIEGGPVAGINYHGVQSVSAGNYAQYDSNGSPNPAKSWSNKWVRVGLHRTLDNKSKIYFDGVLMRTVDTSNRELANAEQAVIFSLGKSNGSVVTGDAGAILVDWFKAYRPL